MGKGKGNAKASRANLTLVEALGLTERMSEETRRLNPHLVKNTPATPCGTPGNAPLTRKRSSHPTDGPQPNLTEIRFQRWYEAKYPNTSLVFSPLTLRIGRRRYTPDWVHFGTFGIHLYEVKGPHIWDDARLKYDLFKTEYGRNGSRLIFGMWQEHDGNWTQIR